MLSQRIPSGPAELVSLGVQIQPANEFMLPAIGAKETQYRVEAIGRMNESEIGDFIAEVLSLDENQNKQAAVWVSENITAETGKERQLVLELLPLQEAQIAAGAAIAKLHSVQERHRAEQYTDRLIPFVVEAKEGIQTQFLEDIGYKAPKGFAKNEIPIGTTFRLDTVDMAMLLDMARHPDGTIDEYMLYRILGTQGSNQYTTNETMRPWINPGLRMISEQIQKYYCGGGVSRQFISSRNYQTGITLRDASADQSVSVPKEKAVEMIDVLATLKQIVTVDENNFIRLQKAGGIKYEPKAEITERIARMTKACNDGKEQWNTVFSREDAQKIGAYLDAVTTIETELRHLGDQIGIRAKEYVEEVEKQPSIRLQRIAQTISGNLPYYDQLYQSDEKVRAEWSKVVETMQNLANVTNAVIEKTKLLFTSPPMAVE